MGFHENALFPEKINYGSLGGPGYSTAIIEVDSGQEERTSRWSAAKHRYNAVYGIKSREDLADLITFYIARRGPAYGFRFKDWLDYSTGVDHVVAPTDTDFQLGLGDNSETQFQLLKKYSDGGVIRTRNITKPVDGTVVVALDGVSQPTGWTVDTTTGIITFTVAPGTDVVVTAGCKFDVPVRFGKELDLVIGLSIDTFSTGGIDDIPLVEIADANAVSDTDEFFYGGSSDRGDMTEDILAPLSIGQGRVIVANPTIGGLSIILPNPSGLPGGGPYFYIFNRNGVNTLAIKNHLDATIFTIPINSGITIVLEASTSTWYAL